jgi:predicted secreted protein
LPVCAVLAQNQFALGTLQNGQILLNLSITEQEEVEQDTLNISLQYSVQGRDPVELQNDVNQTMRLALDTLERDGRIEYSTTQYQVYTIEAGRPVRADVENPVWRAQQGVELTGTDSTVLLELAGSLQAQGLVITSQYYSLSSARYEEIAGRLTQAALGNLQQRAEAAAGSLGKGGAALVEVSLDANTALLTPGASLLCVGDSASIGPNCGAPVLADTVPAIIFSMGADWSSTTSANELENSDGTDNQFVSTIYSEDLYDDQLIWLSPFILFNRLIDAGKLP